MHAISQQLSPTPGCTGIDLLQAHNFDLHCFQCLTGTNFFVVCETGAPNMEMLLKVIYELYTDVVLKNPFYEMEMPIRCELFDHNLAQDQQCYATSLDLVRSFCILKDGCHQPSFGLWLLFLKDGTGFAVLCFGSTVCDDPSQVTSKFNARFQVKLMLYIAFKCF
ncbi:unnamed protein product [Miscanthus lutarioriparius]|uniref:Trafficking protein particle complex subunit n=1 Tax=Miscanthus lutarioriparius TaxID=422564 RepID=A0A811SQU5_9POAL|nr:unnamed protein product [Miscanthus lutarioriparius]